MPEQQFSPIGNQHPAFNQWFLNNKEGIENLKYMWRGYERNLNGMWERTKYTEENRLMNEKGIHWATQVMESYLDKVFQSTSWDLDSMNWAMRKAYRVVWYGLLYQYRNFGISKINVQVIANEMLARIHAILMACRGEGIRKYLSSTQQVSEIRQQNDNQKGFFSALGNMFSRKRGDNYG